MADTQNPRGIVQHYWPYDGPHDADTVTSAVDTLAELTRYLNNATRTTIPAPTLYDLLGALDATANGMRQLIEQLADTAERYSQDTTLRHDAARDDPAAAKRDARHAACFLRDVPDTLADLAERFAEARQPLAHLYHDTDQPEPR